MKPIVLALSVMLTILAGLAPPASAGPFDDMASHIPADANAVVLFDVEKIMESPIAKASGWRDSHAKLFADGMVYLPPNAKRCLMASRVDFEHFNPIWDVTLLDFSAGSVSLAGLAKSRGGRLEKIGGVEAVYLPSDHYAVKLSDSRVAARGPGERQAVARWINTPGSSRQLSRYLQQALAYSDRFGTEIVMALDLDSVLSPGEIEARLGAMQALSRKRNVDTQAIARTLGSVQGVTLGITLGKEPFGKIKVDFHESARPLAGHGKALLLEALGNHGAMIDDFVEWEPKTERNMISIEGTLSEDGMRRIFSIFEAPNAIHSGGAQGGAASGEQQQTQQVVAATRQYFNSVQKLMGDIRDKKAQRLSQYGVWLERYAQKVDNLPLVGVDKDMLDYGRYVAQSLRSASMVVKNRGIRTRAREVSAVASEGYGVDYTVAGGFANRWTGNAGWGYRSGTVIPSYNAYLAEQQSRRTQVRTQETASMASNVQQIKARVQEATATIRRTMAERYQINL